MSEHTADYDATEREHADGCLTEHTWDEHDCNCRVIPPANGGAS